MYDMAEMELAHSQVRVKDIHRTMNAVGGTVLTKHTYVRQNRMCAADGTVRYDTVQLARCGMVWYGTVWYGMV